MKEHLTTEKEKELIEVKPSKREILFNNKVVYAITIMTKRFIDICAGVAGMCVLIPLTIILYIVKIVDKDKGPLFFSQDRIGKDGKLFKMYKFRTMVVGADDVLKKMLDEDEKAREEYAKNKKLKNDPRITKIGKFLRSTSLDEFPQFINVLKGDMSLVGPRPYLPREEDDMGYYYYYITKCKPGITGLCVNDKIRMYKKYKIKMYKNIHSFSLCYTYFYGGIAMKEKEKLLQEVTLLKMNELKPNYSELSRIHECDRRTIKKYFNGYTEKSKHRNKKSKLDIYEDEIKEKLKIPGITISALYNYLNKKYGNIGSYTNLMTFIRNKKLKPSKEYKAHLRFETEYGKQLQFDWKEDIEMYNKYGEIFKFNVFTSILCASRFHVFLYSKNKTRFDVERCLTQTFQKIGGVPKEILTDNMSSIVDINQGKFSTEFITFAKDMGVKPKKCKVRHPYTKGKVESSNRFVNWLKPYNGEFETEEDIIKILNDIMKDTNQKTNETTGVPPIMLYQKEREYLSQLPNEKIMKQYLNDTVTVKVSEESLFYYKGKRYSVSPKYINKNINIIEDNNRLYVYYNRELITMHDISEKKINYQKEHYIEGLQSVLNGIEQEKIEKQAQKALALLENL